MGTMRSNNKLVLIFLILLMGTLGDGQNNNSRNKQKAPKPVVRNAQKMSFTDDLIDGIIGMVFDFINMAQSAFDIISSMGRKKRSILRDVLLK